MTGILRLTALAVVVTLSLAACGGASRQPGSARSSAYSIPARACEGLPEAKCQAAYLLAGLDPRKCDTVTGSGCIDGPVTPPAQPSPAPPAGPLFSCAVLTFNESAARVNAFINAHGYSDNSAKPPEFQIIVTVPALAAVASVTVAGFDSAGAETGSTSVDISQVIAAGQSMTFTSELPGDWYQVTQSDEWGNPVTYQPAATTCQVLTWSQS